MAEIVQLEGTELEAAKEALKAVHPEPRIRFKRLSDGLYDVYSFGHRRGMVQRVDHDEERPWHGFIGTDTHVGGYPTRREAADETVAAWVREFQA